MSLKTEIFNKPMQTISAKFTENQLNYLNKIAIENSLYKSNTNEPSLGKALKEIISWCQKNNINLGSHDFGYDEHYQKILEHIHITIPHIIYLLRLQILFNSDQISDKKILHCKEQSINYLNQLCSDFQLINYKEIHTTSNDIGLRHIQNKQL